jgi:ribosome-associated protein
MPNKRSTRTEVNQMLAAAAAACEDKKAEDIRILALDPSESGLTDYFLICSGNSDRQNVAITDEVEIRLKRDFGTYPTSVEGRRQGEWVLMDYVDFIVHVFSAEKRAYYGLERLRKTATSLTIADLNSEIKAAIAAKRPTPLSPAKKTAKKAVAKKSPTKSQLGRKAPASHPTKAVKAVNCPT